MCSDTPTAACLEESFSVKVTHPSAQRVTAHARLTFGWSTLTYQAAQPPEQPKQGILCSLRIQVQDMLKD